MPPADEAAYEGLARYLADDVADIAAGAGYSLADEIAAYRGAMASIAGRLALMQEYARLFVTPPALVAINAGRYLDGAVLGPAELEMERWYARHGLGRADAFRDLNDHVAVQLEFIAQLFGRAAEREAAGAGGEGRTLAAEAARFLAAFPRRWLPAFIADLERTAAGGGAAPYLALTRMLDKAVARDVDPAAAITPKPVRRGRGGRF